MRQDIPLVAKGRRAKKPHSRLDRPQAVQKVVVNRHGGPAMAQDAKWRQYYYDVLPLVRAHAEANERRYGHR
jgi:hypothetical protein